MPHPPACAVGICIEQSDRSILPVRHRRHPFARRDCRKRSAAFHDAAACTTPSFRIHFSSYSSTAVTPYSFNIRLMSGHVMYPSATQEAAWLSSEASCCKSSIGASCLSMRTYSIKSMPLLSPSTMPSLYALSTSACVRGTLRGLILFGIATTIHPSAAVGAVRRGHIVFAAVEESGLAAYRTDGIAVLILIVRHIFECPSAVRLNYALSHPPPMHHRRNVNGRRVYYITAHIVHPASAAHTAVVVFPCLFAR